MLSGSHVKPFSRVSGGRLRVEYLVDKDGRVVAFLDRLCRLVRRLEGWPRERVEEALRRQERRVRDSARLSGLSKALLDACVFEAPPGAANASAIRDAVFLARGRRWPPLPPDHGLPYEEAAGLLGYNAADLERLLYADAPGARMLVKAPPWNGRSLLAAYNLALARAVLPRAEESVAMTAH